MRSLAISLVILTGTAWAAHAQLAQVLPASPVATTDISNYCVYENKVYSPGSLTCDVLVGPASSPLECQPADAVHKRAYWKIPEKTTVTCK
jgi:hypothetical protein